MKTTEEILIYIDEQIQYWQSRKTYNVLDAISYQLPVYVLRQIKQFIEVGA